MSATLWGFAMFVLIALVICTVHHSLLSSEHLAAQLLRSPPRFRADHPLLFLIRDKETESVLFMSRMLNPEA